MEEENLMDFIKGRLKELSTLDGAVIVGISLGVLLLGPMVKWMAWAGLVYGAYRVLKSES